MSTAPALPFSLPPPENGRPDLLIIAGEHSGDQHAASAVRDLLAVQPELRICALGGAALAAAGVQVLHDLTASSVVGFVEVVRHLGYFRHVFEGTLRWIEEHRPRAICLVDYPGFNLRLAEQLKKRGLSRKGGGAIPVLYYISPQIWAWKARRRFALARTIDAMAVIFPFEVESYADTTLPVRFVGHPFVREHAPSFISHDRKGPILLLPGSRRQAVARIFPALLDGFLWYRANGGDRTAVVVYPSEEVFDQLQRYTRVAPFSLVPSGSPLAASAVLTSSGTMSMRCALAGVPGAIAYRANLFSYLLARRLVKVKFIGIANLLLGEAMYPEHIQFSATPARLAAQLQDCVTNLARAEKTHRYAERLRTLLSRPAEGSVGEWLATQLAADRPLDPDRSAGLQALP